MLPSILVINALESIFRGSLGRYTFGANISIEGCVSPDIHLDTGVCLEPIKHANSA